MAQMKGRDIKPGDVVTINGSPAMVRAVAVESEKFRLADGRTDPGWWRHLDPEGSYEVYRATARVSGS